MIDAVLVKLEELSPFNAPDSFTADPALGGVIQPVRSYAEATLNEAIKETIVMLPLRFLYKDIVNNSELVADVDEEGIGTIHLYDNNAKKPIDVVRLVELKFAEWEKGVIRPIDRTSPEYDIQRNPYTRGGTSKPAVVWTEDTISEVWECYSLPKMGRPYIEKPTKCAYVGLTGNLNSERAAEYAILVCAIKVHNIYGNNANVKLLQDDLTTMLQFDNINL